MFSFQIEGVSISIGVSNHAAIRMSQRGVDKYASYGTIVALGEIILDMKNKEEFCIQDKELNIALCCAIHFDSGDIVIEIITVLDNSMFFVKAGVKVYQLNA
jgi:hypothetical protein